jgi:hypothetical protein
MHMFSKSTIIALCILLFSAMPADAWYKSTHTPGASVGKSVLPSVPGLGSADCEKKLEASEKWKDLGYGIRYIQFSAGSCHYYDGEDRSSANRGGPDTYKYDPHNGFLFVCRLFMEYETLEADMLLIQRCLERRLLNPINNSDYIFGVATKK